MQAPTGTPQASPVVDGIIKSFYLSDKDLVVITKQLIEAFRRGVKGDPNGLAMAPSFITSIPDGTETGTFLTLDFERIGFRVGQVKLDGRRNHSFEHKIFELPQHIKAGEGSVLFDVVADSVNEFLKEKGLQASINNPLPLGLAFGFPLDMTGINKARLTALTKGFSVQNIIGEDIVALLQGAFDRKKVPVKCVAVVNDTVAIFLAQSYLSGKCVLAAIFGLGTNGAFVEEIANIKKLQNTSLPLKGKMLLNTEWGAFDNQRALLPTTSFDNKLHRESLRPSFQSFEKMVSWMYLGEIARNIFLSLIDHSPPILFGGKSTSELNAQLGFQSYYLTLVEESSTLQEVKLVLVNNLGFKLEDISDADANIVRSVSIAVRTRSAKLAACAVAASLIYMGHLTFGQSVPTGPKLPVALFGELMLLYPEYGTQFAETVAAITGEGTKEIIEFIIVEDGGALGAALSAFEATRK